MYLIMWATDTGSEAMKRIAAPMVGGMVSSTVLTLVVIPAIYALWKGWELRQEKIVAEIEQGQGETLSIEGGIPRFTNCLYSLVVGEMHEEGGLRGITIAEITELKG